MNINVKSEGNKYILLSRKISCEVGEDIYSGKFDSLPLETGEGMIPCRFCQYSSICANKDRKRAMVKNEFNKMEREEE